jgi:DNA-binding CsgD family transcriptional regulator
MRKKCYQADWLDQVSSAIDLRKTRSHALTEHVLTRAHLLPKRERHLINAMYNEGKSATEIAHLGNLDPRQVRRLIKNAITRMNDPLFIFVATHANNWSPTRRKIARSLFQSGRSIRATAEHLALKVHQVRHHRAAVLEQYHNQTNSTAPSRTPDRNWKHTTHEY